MLVHLEDRDDDVGVLLLVACREVLGGGADVLVGDVEVVRARQLERLVSDRTSNLYLKSVEIETEDR